MRRYGLVLMLAAGCAPCAPVQPLSVGAQCSLNSECDAPLVCRIDRCRNECATSRDCAAGLDCLLGNDGFGACQLPEETACVRDSDCPSELVCPMGRCVNQCVDDRDCPPGAMCMENACIDPDRETCIYNTDCADRKVCAPDQRCRLECRTDADCRFGTSCIVWDARDAGLVNFCQPRADAGP